MRWLIISIAALAVATLAGGLAGTAHASVADNVMLCQHDGWQGLMDSEAAPFSRMSDCISYAARGGALYNLASIQLTADTSQFFRFVPSDDGIIYDFSFTGLEPGSTVLVTLLRNGLSTTLNNLLTVPASGASSGGPTGGVQIPCVVGSVWTATATGTSADSVSSPTIAGVAVTSNTVSHTATCTP
jgi:hypothetical protein